MRVKSRRIHNGEMDDWGQDGTVVEMGVTTSIKLYKELSLVCRLTNSPTTEMERLLFELHTELVKKNSLELVFGKSDRVICQSKEDGNDN